MTPLQVLDSYLDLVKTSTDEWEMRKASEVKRVRSLIMRAPADRAWRRRCFLVMLRSRNDAEQTSPRRCVAGQEEQNGDRFLAEEDEVGAEASAGDVGALQTREHQGKGARLLGRLGWRRRR